jgi:hypothetical protein
VDGVDLTPLLAGCEQPSADRPVFFHQPHYHQGRPFSAIVVGQWKLLLWHEDGGLELFNVSEDIGESHNMAEQESQRSHALLRTLSTFLKKVGAQFPLDRNTKVARRLEDLAPVAE